MLTMKKIVRRTRDIYLSVVDFNSYVIKLNYEVCFSRFDKILKSKRSVCFCLDTKHKTCTADKFDRTAYYVN